MKTRLALLLSLLAAGFAFSCGRTATPVSAASASPASSATASVTQVSAAPAAGSIPASTPAAVEARQYTTSAPIVVENQVDVAAQREGVVAKTYADIGKHVSRGALLAVLDDSQLRADRAAVEADLAATTANEKNWEAQQKVATSDLDRAQKMYDAQLITQEQLEHSHYAQIAAGFEVDRERHNIQFQQAKLRSLDLEIAKTRIVAPFDGVVARRYVRVGQKVATNDRLFWVSSTGPMRVLFTLPQEWVGAVHAGSSVSVSVPFADQQAHMARVVSVSPVVDPSSGTIEVLAQLVGAPGELRPGMTATIRIDKRP